jgi:solute carrier family 25 (mitochondrial iron transporter), member 28/37
MAEREPNDELEWEEWNPNEISFVKHMVAGSIAGLVEHISIYPIDTVKTHVQYETAKEFGVRHTWRSAQEIVRKEGFLRLWRGVSAMFAGCIPGLL